MKQRGSIRSGKKFLILFLSLSMAVGVLQPTRAYADTIPPIISGVTATGLTGGTATIKWTTNELSSSQIEYGKTTAYGSMTPMTDFTTTHSYLVSGLTPLTLYHYRVISMDADNNESKSNDFTFTTPAASETSVPVISGISLSQLKAHSVTIVWKTNEPTSGQVQYGLTTSYSDATTLTPFFQADNGVSLSGLTGNTLYHYRIRSYDAAGNVATSADATFTTKIDDATAPTFSAPTVTNLAPGNATISWTTNEPATTQIEYGPTTSYGNWTNWNINLTTTHTETITGLTGSTLYHYRLMGMDIGDNSGISADLTFTTPAGESTPPTITEFYPDQIAGTSFVVRWTSDELTKGLIEYGTTSQLYTQSTALETAATLTHSQLVSGLTANTEYFFRVKAIDAAGNITYSYEQTVDSGVAPPVISNVTVTNITDSGATINWTTDRAATTELEYGWTTKYGVTVQGNANFTTSHSQAIQGLHPNLLHHYRVRSTDAVFSMGTSSDLTFKTNAAAAPPLATVNQLAWAKRFGSLMGVELAGVDTDANNNVFVVANYTGTIDLPNGLTEVVGGAYNFFVAKYNSAGTLLWIKTCVGKNGFPLARSMTVDASGNVIVGGQFWGVVNFVGADLTSGSFDGFLVKLDGANSGNALWSKQFGGAADDGINNVTVDPNGNIYMTGTFGGTLNIGATTLASSGSNDIFLAKLNSSATPIWSKKVGGAGDEWDLGITANATSVAMMGSSPLPTIDFGNSVTATGGVVFLSRYDSNGVCSWAKRFDAQTGGSNPIDMDTAGNIVMADSDSVDKFSSAGTSLWSSSLGVITADVIFDRNGDVLTSGTYFNSSVFGGTALTDLGSGDIFVAKLSGTDGSPVFARGWGGVSNDNAFSLAVDSTNNPYSFATFLKGINIGGNTFFASPDYPSAVLVKLNIGSGDLTAPVISNVALPELTANKITLTWTTNEASTSQIEYGTTANYGQSTALDSSMVLSHSQSITGLIANTQYYLRMKSVDAAGNVGTSTQWVISTWPNPPTITSVSAINISSNSATIKWTTDVAANTIVDYGWSTAYGGQNLDLATATIHQIKIDRLAPSTLYHYRVSSEWIGTGTSADFTFTTLAAAQPSLAPVANLVWSKQVKSLFDLGWTAGVATDANNNIFIAGIYNPPIDFGSGIVTSTGAAYIAKFNAAGDLQWSRMLGGSSSGFPFIRRISLDAGGNPIIVGDFGATINLGGSDLVAASLSANQSSSDIFIAKFDGLTSSHLWSKRYGGNGGEGVVQMETDASGNIYLTGNFEGTLNFGAPTSALTSAGGDDIYLAKLTPDGVPVWAKKIGGINTEYVNAMAINSAGSIAWTGTTSLSSIDFGNSVVLSGTPGSFVARYDANGTCTWAKRLVDSENYNPGVLAMDTAGNIAMAFLDGSQIDVYTNAGALKWSKSYPYNDIDGLWVQDMKFDRNSDLILVGGVAGTINMGVVTLTGSNNDADSMIAKISASNGTTLWARKWGSAPRDSVEFAAIDTSNAVIGINSFVEHMAIGSGVYFSNSQSWGLSLVKLNVPATFIYHPADTDNNKQISISEASAYGSCYKAGCTWATGPNPVPIDYMLRGYYLWKTGEAYHNDSVACPACWISGQ